MISPEPAPATTGDAFPFKAGAQLLTAMAVAVLPLVTSGDAPASATEWVNAVLVALGAVTVYIAENQPEGSIWHYTKTILAALTAVGVAAVSALTDASVTATEWYQIIAAGAAVVAVYWIPNEATTPLGRHRAEGG